MDHLEARSEFFGAAERHGSRSSSSEGSEQSSSTGGDGGKGIMVMASRQQASWQISIGRNDPLSRFSETLGDVHNSSQRQALVLQHTPVVLQDLVNEMDYRQ